MCPRFIGVWDHMPGIPQRGRHLSGDLGFPVPGRSIGEADDLFIARLFQQGGHHSGVRAAGEGEHRRPPTQGPHQGTSGLLVSCPERRLHGLQVFGIKKVLVLHAKVALSGDSSRAGLEHTKRPRLHRMDLGDQRMRARYKNIGGQKLLPGDLVDGGLRKGPCYGIRIVAGPERPVHHRIKQRQAAQAVHRQHDLLPPVPDQAEHTVELFQKWCDFVLNAVGLDIRDGLPAPQTGLLCHQVAPEIEAIRLSPGIYGGLQKCSHKKAPFPVKAITDGRVFSG